MLALLVLVTIVGCEDQDSETKIADDPYVERIAEMADSMEMSEGFAERFREDYLRRVTAEIDALGDGGSSDEHAAKVQTIRGLIFFNMWSEEGVDILPPNTWFIGAKDETLKSIKDLELRLMEYEVEIARLHGRIAELESGSEQAAAPNP